MAKQSCSTSFRPARFSDFKTFENTLQQYFAQMKELSILTSNIQIEVHGGVAWITSQYLMAYHQNGQFVRQNGRWTGNLLPG